MDGHGWPATCAVLLARSMLSTPATMPGPHDLFARYTFGHPERAAAEEMIEQGVQKGLEKGLAKGRLQERAEAVLRILTKRGVHADEAARQRILSCSDGATLDRWFDRALNATALSDVLDDQPQ